MMKTRIKIEEDEVRSMNDDDEKGKETGEAVEKELWII